MGTSVVVLFVIQLIGIIAAQNAERQAPPFPSSTLTQPSNNNFPANPSFPVGPTGNQLIPIPQTPAPASSNNAFNQPFFPSNPSVPAAPANPAGPIVINPSFPASPGFTNPSFPSVPAPQPTPSNPGFQPSFPTNPVAQPASSVGQPTPTGPIFINPSFPSVPAPQPAPNNPGFQPSFPTNPVAQPSPPAVQPTNQPTNPAITVVQPSAPTPGGPFVQPGVVVNPSPVPPGQPQPQPSVPTMPVAQPTPPVFPNPAPPATPGVQPVRPTSPGVQPATPGNPGAQPAFPLISPTIPVAPTPGQPGVQTPATNPLQTINQISTTTADFLSTLDYNQIVSFLQIMLLNSGLGRPATSGTRPTSVGGAAPGAGGRPIDITVHVEGYGQQDAVGGPSSPLMQMTLFKGLQGPRMIKMANEMKNTDLGKYVTNLHDYWKSAAEPLRDQYRPDVLKNIDSLNVVPKIKKAIQELLPGLTLGKNPASTAA